MKSLAVVGALAYTFLIGVTQAAPADEIQTYLAEGNFTEALPLLESLSQTAPSPAVLLSLGMVQDALGDVGAAIASLEKAASFDEGFQGDIFDALGRAYQHAYRFPEAELALQKAIKLRAETPGWQRASEDHLGLLYLAWGRHDDAGELFRKTLSNTPDDAPGRQAQRLGYLGRLSLSIHSFGRALDYFMSAQELASDVWGINSPEAAAFSANAGFAAFESGDLVTAREQFLLALETLPDADRPEVLSNLGRLALKEGDPEAAIDAFTQAGRLLRTRFGDSHPTVARADHNLGSALQSIGELDAAKEAFATALRISAASGIPEEHALTVQILQGIGLNALLRDDLASASEYAFRAAEAGEMVMRRAIAAGNNRQRLNYRSEIDFLSLPATLGVRTTDLADLMVRTKGLATPTKKQDPELRALQLKIDQLRLAGNSVPTEDLAALEAAVDSSLPPGLENWQALQTLLPEQGVFIDFLAYTDYTPDPPARRYGAMVTPKSGEPEWVPLGTDARLERWLSAYGRKVRGSRPGALTLHGVLRGLSMKFWEPIEAVLPEDAKTLILAPDAGLHFLPFATLLGKNDDFLCERFPQVVTVGSARDLLPQADANSDKPWEIFAVSDYPGHKEFHVAPELEPIAAEIAEMKDLSGAFKEAEMVGDLSWSNVTTGKNATEANLSKVVSPGILHLVAHGFYTGGVTEGRVDFDIDPLPFYESGIVLSDPLESDDPSRDNVLFAEEAADLDLTGTWIATVSSCSSGLGTTTSGEGVVGLRRALSSAGARNVLLTLWPVSDSASPEFMRRFYATTQNSQNPPGALWALQREELRSHFPEGETSEEKLARAVFLAGPYVLSHRGAIAKPVPPDAVAPSTNQLGWRKPTGLAFAIIGIGFGALTVARKNRKSGPEIYAGVRG